MSSWWNFGDSPSFSKASTAASPRASSRANKPITEGLNTVVAGWLRPAGLVDAKHTIQAEEHLHMQGRY